MCLTLGWMSVSSCCRLASPVAIGPCLVMRMLTSTALLFLVLQTNQGAATLDLVNKMKKESEKLIKNIKAIRGQVSPPGLTH